MSDALDGASHHATEDIAFMRALPNMKVIAPADAAAARWATKYAVENYGPMYLRLSREVYPDLYTEDTKFELGKGAIVRDGSDVTVIACGIMVHKALEAAKILEERLISVRVVDMYSIKPIDRELIVKCAKETGASAPKSTTSTAASALRFPKCLRTKAAAFRPSLSAFRTRSRSPLPTRSFSPNTALTPTALSKA